MADNRFEDYVDVAERIARFYERHPDGSLQPLDPHDPFTIVQPYGTDGPSMVVYVAAAYRHAGDERPGIGMAWELLPGRTPYTKGSELMVAETSAWGRAIAALGIATKRSVATRQEIDAAKGRQVSEPEPRDFGVHHTPSGRPVANGGSPASPKQVAFVKGIASKCHLAGDLEQLDVVSHAIGRDLESLEDLTKVEASKLIDGGVAWLMVKRDEFLATKGVEPIDFQDSKELEDFEQRQQPYMTPYSGTGGAA